ncbi:MAG: PEGA domain-containing protein [Candidatus Shapirobacteria bacterium]|nr:PEGA domain-containing protein [Candidatus Shapirobacteria bacterium]
MIAKKIILPLSALLVVFLIGYFFRHSLFSNAGVLEINTTPEVAVFINGQNMGTTPFKKEFKPQRLEITLAEESDQEKILWQTKVPITSSAITLIKYQFNPSDLQTHGQVLTLSKIPDKKNGALLISSLPNQAIVNLDGETKGYTPLLLEEIPSGHHTLEVNLDGYQNTIIGLNIVNGFQLNAEIKLAKTNNEDSQENLPKTSQENNPMVTILSTPTGWLRVRNGPGTGFAEVARVAPGEEYPLLEKEDDWLKISLSGGEEEEAEGWILGQYGKINEADKKDTVSPN